MMNYFVVAFKTGIVWKYKHDYKIPQKTILCVYIKNVLWFSRFSGWKSLVKSPQISREKKKKHDI